MGIKNYCSDELKHYIECLDKAIKWHKEEMDKIEKVKGGFDDNSYNQHMGNWCCLITIKEDLEGISHKLLEGSYWQYENE